MALDKSISISSSFILVWELLEESLVLSVFTSSTVMATFWEEFSFFEEKAKKQ